METPLLISTVSTAIVGLLLLFKFYFMKAARCKSSARLDGKTVIITGANTGIGKETAKDLAKRGGRIILACRDTTSATAALTQIETVVPGAELVVKHLDLASLMSVRTFAHDINTNEKRVDILINNAGVGWLPKCKTIDGFETTFGVNHLGHFLLTLLLLDKLKSCSPSRVVTVSAHLHIFAKLDFDDLMMEKNYSPLRAYCRSKLANMLFTRQLSKQLRGTGVTCYALHPGVIHTGLMRYHSLQRIPLLSRLLNYIASNLLKTPKEGCQTSVYCAVSEDLTSQTGMYYSNCNLSMPMMSALHEGHSKLLWKRSLEYVGLPADEYQDDDLDDDSDDLFNLSDDDDDQEDIETVSDDDDLQFDT